MGDYYNSSNSNNSINILGILYYLIFEENLPFYFYLFPETREIIVWLVFGFFYYDVYTSTCVIFNINKLGS